MERDNRQHARRTLHIKASGRGRAAVVQHGMISYHAGGKSASTLAVHPRIAKRHPEVTEDDVRAAMRGMIRYMRRSGGEWLAVGLDGHGRLVELVYRYDDASDFFFVYHGMTPPSGKTLRELGLER